MTGAGSVSGSLVSDLKNTITFYSIIVFPYAVSSILILSFVLYGSAFNRHPVTIKSFTYEVDEPYPVHVIVFLFAIQFLKITLDAAVCGSLPLW